MHCKFIAILLILFLAAAGSTFAGTDAEKTAVENAARAIINAYNSGHLEEAYRFLSPTYSEFNLNGKELFSFPDIVPPVPATVSSGGPPPVRPKYNLKLDNYTVKVYGESAILTGYIEGSIIEPDGKYEGPWRTSIFYIKKDGRWLIDNLHMSPLKPEKLNYLVQLPQAYDQQERKKWPLIVFLHGMESRGSNLDLVKARVLPKIAAAKKDFPFILVSPQCPANSVWDDHILALNSMLDEVTEKYIVDKDRIYLTGMSLGGHGAWVFAMAYPGRFAAIAPVCGWADPNRVDRLKDIPVWAFHGDKDDLVPLSYEQKAMDTLKEIGGDVKYTVYPGVDHNAWDPTYNNDELYKWFLQHKKEK